MKLYRSRIDAEDHADLDIGFAKGRPSQGFFFPCGQGAVDFWQAFFGEEARHRFVCQLRQPDQLVFDVLKLRG